MYLSRNKARMNAYPFFHILNKAKAHDVNIADSKECSSADLFIAAPINNDPFVFQVTPIGVMIHSKWGVEAEDNIFDNIKTFIRLWNLSSLKEQSMRSLIN